MYWRIPSALSPSDLKALATSLTTRSIQDQHDQQVSSSDEENDGKKFSMSINLPPLYFALIQKLQTMEQSIQIMKVN